MADSDGSYQSSDDESEYDRHQNNAGDESYSESYDSDSDDEAYGANDEDNDGRYSSGDATVLPSSTSRLEKISSMNVTIAMWNRAVAQLPELPLNTTNDVEWRKSFLRIAREWTEQLPLPKLFVKHIVDNFKDIVLNVQSWISYHYREVYLRQGSQSDLHRHLGCIVWHPNGSVNQYQTAVNMLHSDGLDDVIKFRLACTYCMREEIEIRWPAMHESNLIDTVEFRRHPLIYYWKQYCTGEALVPPYNEHMSVDEKMITQLYADKVNWPAVEYFFDRLNAEEQVRRAQFVVASDNAWYQNLILTKLDLVQRWGVYSDKAVRIIRNYARAGGADINDPNAISTWHEACQLILNNQFVSLMKRLCRVKASKTVLVEIWSTAYDDFKRSALNVRSYDFIGDLLRWCCHQKEDVFDFLFTVLADRVRIGSEPRSFDQNKFLIKLCEKLVSSNRLESANWLLKCCIPDAEKCAKFKLKVVNKNTVFDTYCQKLMTDHEFIKFEQLLKFFRTESLPESRVVASDLLLKNLKHIESRCLDFYAVGNLNELNETLAPFKAAYPEVILEFKKQLLFSKRGLQECSNHLGSTSNILSEIVADGLPDSELVKKFGKEMIFSSHTIRKLHALIRDKNFPNAVVRRNLNLLLKSSKDKRALKFKLLYCLTSGERGTEADAKKKYSQLLWTLF